METLLQYHMHRQGNCIISNHYMLEKSNKALPLSTLVFSILKLVEDHQRQYEKPGQVFVDFEGNSHYALRTWFDVDGDMCLHIKTRAYKKPVHIDAAGQSDLTRFIHIWQDPIKRKEYIAEEVKRIAAAKEEWEKTQKS